VSLLVGAGSGGGARRVDRLGRHQLWWRGRTVAIARP
jgi:hypothetical protein